MNAVLELEVRSVSLVLRLFPLRALRVKIFGLQGDNTFKMGVLDTPCRRKLAKSGFLEGTRTGIAE
jgi:hypothetical protein